MRRIFRHYSLEAVALMAGLLIIGGSYLLFRLGLKFSKDELLYVSVANAGFLFIVGQIYSRLKERREIKIKRAQELFLEWHSKDIRESRIFVSRWREVNPSLDIPSLGSLEREAAEAFKVKYQGPIVVATSPSGDVTPTMTHDVDDPELKELHFFRIYQFFERWALLVKVGDIDHRSATEYLGSYKLWYLENYIEPWLATEDDVHIRPVLQMINERVRASR